MKLSKSDKLKRNNLKGLFTNSSTRPMLFITAGILLGLLGLGYFGMSHTANQDDTIKSSASVGDAPNVVHQPGVNSSKQHDILQQKANQKALKNARKEGKSSIPVITGNYDVNSPLTLPDLNKDKKEEKPVSIVVSPPVQKEKDTSPIEKPQPVVPRRTVPRRPSSTTLNKNIDKQIVQYLQLWGPGQRAFQEYVYVDGSSQKGSDVPVYKKASYNKNSVYKSDNVHTNGSSESQDKPQSDIRFVRAGSTAPAVLITPLNSDAPGPVVAQIRSGPLAGARLIGTMRVQKESILVVFSKISKPGWPDTYPIEAVGMSRDYSTALATDVNHHYLQKYIGILGGAFTKGYGEAMQQQGQITSIGPNGNVITKQDSLNSKEIRRSAQGEVLSQIGKDWKKNSNRDTTIKVKGDNGKPYPIQVLFLANF